MFLLGDVSKTLQIPWFLLPVAQNIVNTGAFGFRGAKHIGIYGVLCSSQKKRENTTY